jgi:O-antigen biosynthesis protein
MALRSVHGRHLLLIASTCKNLSSIKFTPGRSRGRSHSSINAAANSGDGLDPQSVLFISPVWPERSSSAAGVRSCDLISSFQDRNYSVSYASPSTPNEHTSLIQASGVTTFECPPNNEDALAAVLQATRPSVVLFDRFYAEEMFSFRIKDILPDALRVLDMQDVHFLREGRQLLAKQLDSGDGGGGPIITLQDILNYRPDTTFPSLLRELASIYRSDLTLVCSPVELTMLREEYQIPSESLLLAPFFAPPSPYAAAPVPWSDRSQFIMIGNFRHPPNFDSVRWTCREIWPLIRKNLGKKAELHLYGSYAPQAASELNNPVSSTGRCSYYY